MIPKKPTDEKVKKNERIIMELFHIFVNASLVLKQEIMDTKNAGIITIQK